VHFSEVAEIKSELTMRALLMCTFVLAACGGDQGTNTELKFNGSWSGTLMHPATMCSDGSSKAAYSAPTSFQINQDLAGILLTWLDRCPVTYNIGFSVDGAGTTATQLGDPALCINMPTVQATLSSGSMMVNGGALTLTFNETETDTGVRDCGWIMTMMMTRQ
jgi:hypothetical protein